MYPLWSDNSNWSATVSKQRRAVTWARPLLPRATVAVAERAIRPRTVRCQQPAQFSLSMLMTVVACERGVRLPLFDFSYWVGLRWRRSSFFPIYSPVKFLVFWLQIKSLPVATVPWGVAGCSRRCDGWPLQQYAVCRWPPTSATTTAFRWANQNSVNEIIWLSPG